MARLNVTGGLPFGLGVGADFVIGTNSIISNIEWQLIMVDTGGMKRTVQVNVKMSPEDFNLLKRAAERRWPEAVMTNSGVVLGLAKIAAKATLTKAKN